MEYVFGYGSLAARSAGGHAAELHGHRRRWGVAMDNRRELPGYKCYRLPGGEVRPPLFVAFLDVVRTAGTSVNGVCHPLVAGELDALDARERNYDRVDVTGHVPGARGRVWAYVGSAAGRARMRQARRDGSAAVSRAYLEGVEAGFARRGPAELAAYRASTDPPGCRVLELQRVDLPH